MAAPKGNKYASEWTLENALPRFQDALEFAEKNDECLCLQDAIYHTGISYTTFDYLAHNHEVLMEIKSNIKAAVIRRINRGAVKNKYASIPCIFRMKQLGEREEQTINNNMSGEQSINVMTAETAIGLKKLRRKFEEEKSNE